MVPPVPARRSCRAGNALADIEEHAERYEAYGKQARLTYEQRFDPECSIEQLLEIYRYATMHPTGRASLRKRAGELRGTTWSGCAASVVGELQRGDEVIGPARRKDAAGSDGRVARRASSNGMRDDRPAHASEPRRFGVKRPRLKVILLACLVADVVVVGSLVAANMVGGADPLPPGPTAQVRPQAGMGPSAPPARICGNAAILGGGPMSASAGAVTVPAGSNAGVDFSQPHTTYWFAPGVHTLGSGQYTQILPGRGSTYVGAPGAILDGQHDNLYAFGGSATGVTISYLTVQNFGGEGDNQDQGVVNVNSASGWTVDHSTLKDNAGAGIMLGSHNTLSHDCLADNQQYGFNAYSPDGPVDLVLKNNEIAGNDTLQLGGAFSRLRCTGGGKFWDVKNAVIENNWIHDNHSVGLLGRHE
jgi:hypothetical protein